MNKKWQLQDTTKDKEKLANEISKECDIDNIIANILINRGIKNLEEAKIFLNPTRNDFHNPFDMPDMKIAVDRIIKAINEKEKIIIYGDYDVDGITSVTVLKNYLLERGADVSEYIPNRLSEGYGLNISAVEKIADENYTLMITVDTGISGIEEVKKATELGIDVIITDHHEPKDILPEDALAIIDCKREDSKYPFRELCGCGVAFKLISAISQELNIPEEEYLKYIDLVAIGTISDIVPLIDENRVIASLGLKLIPVTRNLGLWNLVHSIGMSEINSYTVSFGIAPRINACGRMGHEEDALKLFLETDKNKANEITQKLNEYNLERQNLEKKIFEEADKLVKEDEDIIVLKGTKWHHGVIGIVCSKLTDKYFKPSILLSCEDDELIGSGRSIPGFDLHKALMNNSKYLEKFGGHEMAVGLSLKQENFQEFKKELLEYSQNEGIHDIIPTILVDEELSLKDCTLELAKELEKLEPFGEANKSPIFLIKNVKINSIRTLTDGKHLKLTLGSDQCILDAIGFNLGFKESEFVLSDKVDVVGNLDVNEFNGRQSVQIIIKDIKKAM